MIISMVLVVLGSVLGGLSESMEQLIAFRVLQGLGGGDDDCQHVCCSG
jgi:MFS family permease